MKHLNFTLSTWDFTDTLQFTVRRGVREFEPGQRIRLRCLDTCGTLFQVKKARVSHCQIMRFSDIPHRYFTDFWHMQNRIWPNRECDFPLSVMRECYTRFDPDEIVTLVWFVVV